MGHTSNKSIVQTPANHVRGHSSSRTTSSISIGCGPASRSKLPRSMGELASASWDTGVSNRPTSPESGAKTGIDRQDVVTIAEASACDGTGLACSRSSTKDRTDPIFVLHESLFSAGISPAAIASTDEAANAA
jgi:hypothetical protein